MKFQNNLIEGRTKMLGMFFFREELLKLRNVLYGQVFYMPSNMVPVDVYFEM